MLAPRAVSAELPESGERFRGLGATVVTSPVLRHPSPAIAVFTAWDYVDAASFGRPARPGAVRAAVNERKNVLVAGGTRRANTLVNALSPRSQDRRPRRPHRGYPRLQCAAPNLVALRTRRRHASLSDLSASCCGCVPTGIPIGEVRGAEAL